MAAPRRKDAAATRSSLVVGNGYGMVAAAVHTQRAVVAHADGATMVHSLVLAKGSADNGSVAIDVQGSARHVRLIARKGAAGEGGRAMGVNGSTIRLLGLVALEDAVAYRKVVVALGVDTTTEALGSIAVEGASGCLTRAPVKDTGALAVVVCRVFGAGNAV